MYIIHLSNDEKEFLELFLGNTESSNRDLASVRQKLAGAVQVMPERSYRTFLNNVENWRFKSLAEVEQLSDEQIEKEQQDLSDAMRLFRDHNVPLTDEMFWLMCTLVRVKTDRKNEPASLPDKIEP